MFSLQSFGVIALTATSLAVCASGGSIYSTGFETDALGTINGQDGWKLFNPGASFDNVQTVKVFAGNQAAWVGPTGTVQTGMYHTDTASGSPIIDLNAEIYLYSSSTESGWQFAATGAGLAPFIGGIDLNPNGAIDNVVGITQGFPILAAWTLNTWHNIDLLFNFTTQTYTISLDGIAVGTNLKFCNDNGPCTTAGTITEGPFLSFFDVFATANSNDLGAIDNLSLSSVSATPEPGSILLIASGLAFLALKARARR